MATHIPSLSFVAFFWGPSIPECKLYENEDFLLFF